MLKVGDRVYIYRMKPAAKGGLVRNNDKGTMRLVADMGIDI